MSLTTVAGTWLPGFFKCLRQQRQCLPPFFLRAVGDALVIRPRDVGPRNWP